MRFDSKLFLAGAVALAFLGGCKDNGGASGGNVTLSSEDDKTVYTLGVILGRNAEQFKLTPAQIAIAKEGFADAAAGKKPQVELATYGPKVNEMAKAKQEEANKENIAKAAAQKEKDKPFLEAAAKEAGAEKHPSGVVVKTITEGKGAQPKATDFVKVNYTGKLADGTVFDASEKHGGAQPFFLNRVVPCWTEGVQKMKVGGKALLTCPSEAAYGDHGQPPSIPGGAVLQFEVELVSIEEPPKMPNMPMMPGMHPGMTMPGAKPGTTPAATKPGTPAPAPTKK